MNSMPDHEPQEAGGTYRLNTWIRVYVHGLLALAALAAIGLVLFRLAAAFDFTGNLAVAVATLLLVLALGPPIIGSIILFWVFPLLNKKGWRDWVTWDQRLLRQLASVESQARVVIMDFPSPHQRILAVMTTTFEANGQTLASVYVATTPDKWGRMYVVPMDRIEMTGWTLSQWQMYQMTYGAVSPDRLDTPQTS